jgi:DHA2 family multidrug resistance protein-like MFS transporter
MAVFAISCGTALNVIDGAIPNVALPTIATDLGISSAAAVLIVSIYQLVLVMTLLPFSALGSLIGLKRLYLYGQGVFILAALLCFFAPSLPLLLAARGLQALGAAAALSVSSALVRSIYPAGQLGRGLGINSVVVASAAAVAPILGGFIVAAANWQWVFVATVPLGLLSLALGRVFLPDSPARRETYDLPGALLCALSFGLIIAGLLGGIGMAIATLGMLLLAFLPEGASYGSIAWRMAICGVGYGMFLSPNARLVVSAAPLARAASAGGLISTNRLLAQTLGATLLAGLLNLGYGSNATPALIAAALALCAGICSVARLALPDAPGISEERQG